MKIKMMNVFFMSIILAILMKNAGSISITDSKIETILDSRSLNNIDINNIDSPQKNLDPTLESKCKKLKILFYYN